MTVRVRALWNTQNLVHCECNVCLHLLKNCSGYDYFPLPNSAATTLPLLDQWSDVISLLQRCSMFSQAYYGSNSCFVWTHGTAHQSHQIKYTCIRSLFALLTPALKYLKCMMKSSVVDIKEALCQWHHWAEAVTPQHLLSQIGAPCLARHPCTHRHTHPLEQRSLFVCDPRCNWHVRGL